MGDFFQILAERKIREAMEKGEFDNLPGKGKTLVFEDRHVPSDVRILYKIMKNAGLLPDVVALKKEIETLSQQLKNSTNEEEKEKVRQAIADKQLHLGVLMDQRRTGK